MTLPNNCHPASYRDPSGYVYFHEGLHYRFVSTIYQQHYEYATQKDLFKKAVKKNWLLDLNEVSEQHIDHNLFYKTLLPEQIRFDSYPWEWSFDQFKDAAVTTLELCRLALSNGMILKDATPLNLRLMNGKMKWIDHLSFEIYRPGEAWIAYRQFCEMFLNPLLIAAYCGTEVHRLLQAYPSGITAETTASLLPFKCRLRLHIQLHVYLQAKVQQGSPSKKESRHSFSAEKILRILDSLLSCVQSLSLPDGRKIWSNYYEETILSQDYLSNKKNIVSAILSETNYASVLDAGSNDGAMALLCNKDADVIGADSDSLCVNHLYNYVQQNKIGNIYPVVLDLTFPSGGMGWNNSEHKAFFKRKQFDVILALALIHHLCIGKNIPMEKLASFFAEYGRVLIIEFVPKKDPKVQEMLKNREDIFDHYTQEYFELCFSAYFDIKEKQKIAGSDRTIYKLLRK